MSDYSSNLNSALLKARQVSGKKTALCGQTKKIDRKMLRKMENVEKAEDEYA